MSFRGGTQPVGGYLTLKYIDEDFRREIISIADYELLVSDGLEIPYLPRS